MQNYNCKNCGAELYWDVDENCLKCQYCDSRYHPSDFEDLTDTKDEVQNEEVDQTYTNVEADEGMVVYECKNCGGEIITLKTTMATICPYCGEAVSITSKSVGEFRPELCIPFKKDKKEIMNLFKEYVNRSFLTPAKFKEEHTIEKCQGLFAPFYLHSMVDHSRHVFEGQQLSSHRCGDDKVTVHRIFELVLEADGRFERIPTDGSIRIDDKLMEAVEPFDYKGCKPYNPAYMAGFAAEQTDDDKEKLIQRAQERVKAGMLTKAQKCFPDYGYITLRSDQHNFSDQTSEYAMLPVWLLNVKYQGKKYTFAINGQSGKVVGKLPLNKLKLAGITLASFLLSDVVLALIISLINLGGLL